MRRTSSLSFSSWPRSKFGTDIDGARDSRRADVVMEDGLSVGDVTWMDARLDRTFGGEGEELVAVMSDVIRRSTGEDDDALLERLMVG